MRKSFTFLLAGTLLLLCALLGVQSIRATHQQQEIADLKVRLEESARQVDQLISANALLTEERGALLQALASLQNQPADMESTPAESKLTSTPQQSPEQPASELGGFLSKIMEDPEMEQFVRAQQRLMVDPLYQPLIRRLGLTEEDANAFKNFLAESQMEAARHAPALLSGSATDRDAALQAMKVQTEQNETAAREFLGEEGYAMYKEYQETLGERAQLNQFKMQSAGSEYALSDDQTEWLLQVMKEEKEAMGAFAEQPLGGDNPDAAHRQALLSKEAMDQLLQQQEAVNQRVYERAQAGLTPQQVDAFGRFLTNQVQMMRVGMNMAKAMFSPEQPD